MTQTNEKASYPRLWLHCTSGDWLAAVSTNMSGYDDTPKMTLDEMLAWRKANGGYIRQQDNDHSPPFLQYGRLEPLWPPIPTESNELNVDLKKEKQMTSIESDLKKLAQMVQINQMISDLSQKSKNTVYIETRFEGMDGDQPYFEFDVHCDGCQRIRNSMFDAIIDLYETWHELNPDHQMMTITGAFS